MHVRMCLRIASCVGVYCVVFISHMYTRTSSAPASVHLPKHRTAWPLVGIWIARAQGFRPLCGALEVWAQAFGCTTIYNPLASQGSCL